MVLWINGLKTIKIIYPIKPPNVFVIKSVTSNEREDSPPHHALINCSISITKLKRNVEIVTLKTPFFLIMGYKNQKEPS